MVGINDVECNQLLCNKWYVPEELMKETPSVVRGMSVAEEMEYRRRGIRFIKYMMRYLTFEKIIQGSTLDQTKTPRVFPTAVHIFHRFYTVHPFQFFNEYVRFASLCLCIFYFQTLIYHYSSTNITPNDLVLYIYRLLLSLAFFMQQRLRSTSCQLTEFWN